MAVQNKFEVLVEAEGVDQQWLNFKIVATEATGGTNTKRQNENKIKVDE